ncbi:LOW QUALITY PROTEIN: ATP-dependent DNA helicase [Frankliniella fusca]|uniref:ATP-dependent DNA helicase n=1 Tax=Frankliniella fusca TaxID=407009 RepID=A0AAE1HN53_9NEOP|nr:LOW QUALITY PROTEIN: ATP-dependent DNA helicase [Frankliniella fusca]
MVKRVKSYISVKESDIEKLPNASDIIDRSQKYLTKRLNDELGENSYILAAPTGVSAVLINGKTLHSVFNIPPRYKDFKPLTGEKARCLTNSLSKVKFLVIDEYSMIGCKTLAMVSRRCKEAVGNNNEDFGGLNVILFGDVKQLPQVKDRALYKKVLMNNLNMEGKSIIMAFDGAYILNQCHRQNDARFLQLLDNLSNCTVTPDDYKLLTTRFTSEISQEEQQYDALHLFSTKEDVKKFNLIDLTTGDYCPTVKISSRNNCAIAANLSEAEGLQKDLYLAKGAKIMLRSNLWVEKKLVNGSIGNVYDILYAEENFPSVVLCQFPEYDGPSIIPGKNIIPIKAALKAWTDEKSGMKCTRYQFPIALAYACTIHKSQGMTIDKVVVDIGELEFALGLTYVAISRVRSLSEIAINPHWKN